MLESVVNTISVGYLEKVLHLKQTIEWYAKNGVNLEIIMPLKIKTTILKI